MVGDEGLIHTVGGRWIIAHQNVAHIFSNQTFGELCPVGNHYHYVKKSFLHTQHALINEEAFS